MTLELDEAIKRFINNAEYERTRGSLEGCLEFKQLAEWLKELKAVHDEIDDADDEDEIFIGYLRQKMRGE